jgi:hypothetical protein
MESSMSIRCNIKKKKNKMLAKLKHGLKRFVGSIMNLRKLGKTKGKRK